MHTITTFRLNPNQKNTNMEWVDASGIRSKISGLSYEKGVKLPGALFHKHDETYIQKRPWIRWLSGKNCFHISACGEEESELVEDNVGKLSRLMREITGSVVDIRVKELNESITKTDRPFTYNVRKMCIALNTDVQKLFETFSEDEKKKYLQDKIIRHINQHCDHRMLDTPKIELNVRSFGDKYREQRNGYWHHILNNVVFSCFLDIKGAFQVGHLTHVGYGKFYRIYREGV